jgi:hypothetical protein
MKGGPWGAMASNNDVIQLARGSMGTLNDMKTKIERAIADKKLDGAAVRGKIALQTGFILSLVNASSPDDPAKVDKLRKAAEAVLQLKL